ncbi:hypothetical protein IJU97_05005 [bacterium]|nr:hypothetical protein [bacterium]
MGIHADGTPLTKFNPNRLVTRKEFATVFSRVLYGNKYNTYGDDYYTRHLNALKGAGILDNTTPQLQELR